MSATDGVAERHLFGRENEFGFEGNFELFESVIRSSNVIGPAIPGVDRVGTYLENGARFYIDYHNTPEYSGPECQTLRELVAADVAGQRFVRRFVSDLNERQQAAGDNRPIVFNSRVADDKNNTWGCHENYSVPRSIDPTTCEVSDVLATHFATRQVFVGVGEMRNLDPESLSYQAFVSQKTRRVRTTTNSSTTSDKPLINLRDEPLGNRRRLHITCGDATSSPWATAMAFGTTSLVLRLLEHEVRGVDEMIIHDPVKAARLIGDDLELNSTVQLDNLREVSALDIQEHFMTLSTKLAEQVQLPEEEMVVLAEWQRAIDDARVDPMNLDHRAEWVAKLSLADSYRERTDLSVEDRGKRIHGLDMAWGEQSDRGAAARMVARGWFEDPLQAISYSYELGLEAPEGRAALRGKAIGLVADKKATLTDQVFTCQVDWNSVSCLQETVHLEDVFGEDPLELEQYYYLLEKIEAL